MMPAALVTHAERWSWMSAWPPAGVAEVTEPGTGISEQPKSSACRAVIRGAAALGSLDHGNATGQRRDGGAARHHRGAP
jgi:hypothetical protein